MEQPCDCYIATPRPLGFWMSHRSKRFTAVLQHLKQFCEQHDLIILEVYACRFRGRTATDISLRSRDLHTRQEADARGMNLTTDQVTDQVTGEVTREVAGEVAREVAGQVAGEVIRVPPPLLTALNRRQLSGILPRSADGAMAPHEELRHTGQTATEGIPGFLSHRLSGRPFSQ